MQNKLDYSKYLDMNFGNEIINIVTNIYKFTGKTELFSITNRISMNLERFIILGYIDSNIEGHIIGKKGGINSIEIIGFTGSSIVREELLKAFINQVYVEGLSRIELYTEEENVVLLGDQYGFITYDSNVCFIQSL